MRTSSSDKQNENDTNWANVYCKCKMSEAGRNYTRRKERQGAWQKNMKSFWSVLEGYTSAKQVGEENLGRNKPTNVHMKVMFISCRCLN